MPDRYECQPANWADPPEPWHDIGGMTADEIMREPDPEMVAEIWADKAPPGWQRCAKCGEEWAMEDAASCECER